MSRPGLSLRGQVAQAEEHGSSGSSGVGTASGLGPEDRGFETLLPDSIVQQHNAAMTEWQCASLPSWRRGFNSLWPLGNHSSTSGT